MSENEMILSWREIFDAMEEDDEELSLELIGKAPVEVLTSKDEEGRYLSDYATNDFCMGSATQAIKDRGGYVSEEDWESSQEML